MDHASFVVVHVAGVVIESLVRRENLIGAMITGHKPGERENSKQLHRLISTPLSLSIAGFDVLLV